MLRGCGMTDTLKCDLCDADAGDDPYHATMDENGHVHICAACFDPQQHDVGVLKQQRDELLAALRGLRDAFIGTSVEVQADAMRAARAAIAKAGGAV